MGGGVKRKDEKTVFSQSNSPPFPPPRKVGEEGGQLFLLREKDECHPGLGEWAGGFGKEPTSSGCLMPFASSALLGSIWSLRPARNLRGECLNTLGPQKSLVLEGERDGRDRVVTWGRKRKKRGISRFKVTSSKLRLKTNAKILQTQVFRLF